VKHGLYKKIFDDFRPMMKVPWTKHKTNEEILQMFETEKEIMDSV